MGSLELQRTKIESWSVSSPELPLGMLATELWQAAEQGSLEGPYCKPLASCSIHNLYVLGTIYPPNVDLPYDNGS